MSWFGGLAAGVAAGLAFLIRKRWPLVPSLAAAAPALALGQMFGRLGCFLVGDDYGRPTDLPWGVAFPRGLPPTTVPVHPTQLYEAGFLAVLTFLLVRWRREDLPDRLVLARYFLLAGAVRFAIELVRVNPAVALGMTVAQWASLLVVVGGVGLLVWRRRTGRDEAGGLPLPSSAGSASSR